MAAWTLPKRISDCCEILTSTLDHALWISEAERILSRWFSGWFCPRAAGLPPVGCGRLVFPMTGRITTSTRGWRDPRGDRETFIAVACRQLVGMGGVLLLRGTGSIRLNNRDIREFTGNGALVEVEITAFLNSFNDLAVDITFKGCDPLSTRIDSRTWAFEPR